ncbi:LemA family protein [uncultured archaeon]|nr:LemA family protein [uncultured archaeon]
MEVVAAEGEEQAAGGSGLNTSCASFCSMDNKVLVILGVVAVLFVFAFIPLLYVWSTYNTLVNMDEGVKAQWQQVEVVYQRRADLIPNLVSVAQGYADFEKSTLTEVTALRSQWQNAKTVDEKVNAANGLDGAIARLLLVAENYPNLKSDQQFLRLQDELSGTENRISVERMRYNDAAREYNAKIRTFPASFVAGIAGLGPHAYFEASTGAENAPKVDFNFTQ